MKTRGGSQYGSDSKPKTVPQSAGDVGNELARRQSCGLMEQLSAVKRRSFTDIAISIQDQLDSLELPDPPHKEKTDTQVLVNRARRPRQRVNAREPGRVQLPSSTETSREAIMELSCLESPKCETPSSQVKDRKRASERLGAKKRSAADIAEGFEPHFMAMECVEDPCDSYHKTNFQVSGTDTVDELVQTWSCGISERPATTRRTSAEIAKSIQIQLMALKKMKKSSTISRGTQCQIEEETNDCSSLNNYKLHQFPTKRTGEMVQYSSDGPTEKSVDVMKDNQLTQRCGVSDPIRLSPNSKADADATNNLSIVEPINTASVEPASDSQVSDSNAVDELVLRLSSGVSERSATKRRTAAEIVHSIQLHMKNIAESSGIKTKTNAQKSVETANCSRLHTPRRAQTKKRKVTKDDVDEESESSSQLEDENLLALESHCGQSRRPDHLKRTAANVARIALRKLKSLEENSSSDESESEAQLSSSDSDKSFGAKTTCQISWNPEVVLIKCEQFMRVGDVADIEVQLNNKEDSMYSKCEGDELCVVPNPKNESELPKERQCSSLIKRERDIELPVTISQGKEEESPKRVESMFPSNGADHVMESSIGCEEGPCRGIDLNIQQKGGIVSIEQPKEEVTYKQEEEEVKFNHEVNLDEDNIIRVIDLTAMNSPTPSITDVEEKFSSDGVFGLEPSLFPSASSVVQRGDLGVQPSNEAKPGGSLYSCDKCKFFTNQKSLMKSHRETHTESKVHECDICKLKFYTSRALVTHKKTHKARKLLVQEQQPRIQTEESFNCDQCDYRGSCSGALIWHKRIHAEEKPFACDQCNYRSNNCSALIAHKRTHTGEKPFACDQCDYRGCSSGALLCHQRVHTGEKPFACDQCDYRGCNNRELIAHKRTHAGEKPFACDQCDYRGCNNRELIAHKRTHAGGRPAPRDSCNFVAANRNTLVQHHTTHIDTFGLFSTRLLDLTNPGSLQAPDAGT